MVGQHGPVARPGILPGSRTIRRGAAVLIAAVLSLVPILSLFGLTAAVAQAAPACPCSLFPASTVPTVVTENDANAVELGVTFYSDTAGFIDGISFYKGPQNTGTHVGSLWSSTGQLLAQATFSSESASGWQEVNFSAPVAIAANTNYVASYHTNVGFYSATPAFFTNSGYDNAPLHAPGNNTGNPNGLFVYSPVPTFPTGTFNGNNYFVDAVFTPLALPASITVTGASASPTTGTSEQLDAMANYGSGPNSDITSAVTWSSGNTAVATVSPTGSLTAVGIGTTTVTASLYGVIGSFPVTVVAPVVTLSSISISEAASSLPDHLSEPLMATGHYSDGSSTNLTSQVTWASASSSVASVSSTGQVTANGRGPVNVTATLGGVIGSTTITALAPVLFLTVQPPLSFVLVGQTAQLQSRALLTDGTWYASSALTTWGVLPGGPVAITSTGVVSSAKVGIGIVTAQLGSSYAIAAVVFTTPPPPYHH